LSRTIRRRAQPQVPYRSGNCVLCGVWRLTLHRDHIVPRFKGGGNEPDNIQMLCANCHEDKSREEQRGKVFAEEHRRKLSMAHAGKSYPHPKARGVPLPESHRKAIGLSLRGRTMTAEHRARLSEARRAWWQKRRAACQTLPVAS
jgi:hypothetical protein